MWIHIRKGKSFFSLDQGIGKTVLRLLILQPQTSPLPATAKQKNISSLQLHPSAEPHFGAKTSLDTQENSHTWTLPTSKGKDVLEERFKINCFFYRGHRMGFPPPGMVKSHCFIK